MIAVTSPRPVVASPRVAPADLPWFLLWDEHHRAGVVHVYRKGGRGFQWAWSGIEECLMDFLNLDLLGYPDPTLSTLRKNYDEIREIHRHGRFDPVHVERLMEVFEEGDE